MRFRFPPVSTPTWRQSVALAMSSRHIGGNAGANPNLSSIPIHQPPYPLTPLVGGGGGQLKRLHTINHFLKCQSKIIYSNSVLKINPFILDTLENRRVFCCNKSTEHSKQNMTKMFYWPFHLTIWQSVVDTLVLYYWLCLVDKKACPI